MSAEHSAEKDLPLAFTVQRKDAEGRPVGERLTFTEESFIIQRCICTQTTSRLRDCPAHPASGVIPPGVDQSEAGA